MDEAVEEGSGSDDGGTGKELATIAELKTENAAVRPGWTRNGLAVRQCLSEDLVDWLGFFDDKVDNFGLANVKAGLGLENLAHLDAVKLLVALGARAPDGRAARGVEEAELDAYSIGDFAHDAAECIDFADEMALGDAADGGVAAHLGNEVEVHSDERGLEAHARGGHGGLAAGMTGAHDNDIVLFGESHPILFYGWNQNGAAVGVRDCLVS